MKELEKLIERVVNRININLREPAFDSGPYLRSIVPLKQFGRFYAFYALTPHHPLHFRFHGSSLGGSYFLGKCFVDHSVLYKSDIRGDELKCRGDVFRYGGLEIPLHDDEVIHIKDSYLIKTLVHNYSHDPENLEEFLICNTASTHYANIHGSTVEGCFLGPFSTVDLTTLHDCVIGAFAYVQVGELSHEWVPAGEIRIEAGDRFRFNYHFDADLLKAYVHMEPGTVPQGILMDFMEDRKTEFQRIFDVVHLKAPIPISQGTSLSRYAVVKGDTHVDANVLVAQRAYLEDAWLGKGSNAQENCCIIHSRLEGENVTAHGGKLVRTRLGKKVFVGFNSFLRGMEDAPLTIGGGSVVMPHTIIDIREPLEIPPNHLIWGLIRNREDLKVHSLDLDDFAKIGGRYDLGRMRFEGDGAVFVEAFRHRIEHILEANGAYFDGRGNRGHAQKDQDISYNMIQPYPKGRLKGLYPSIDIRP